jgi:WD40 repeat protein
LALRAWEQHDVIEAERILGATDPAFEQTWEQRHLRALCGKARRLPVRSSPVAVSADGLLVAVKTVARVDKPTEVKMGKGPEADLSDEMVKVYDLATGREKITIRTTLTAISTLTFSPDGRQIALAAVRPLEGIDPRMGLQGVVEVFDAATGRRALSLCGKNSEGLGSADSVAFSADGRHIVVKSQEGQVSAWDTAAGREVFSLRGALGETQLLQFSPDGGRIATVSNSNGPVFGAEVWLWDGESGEQKFLLRKERRVAAGNIRMAFSPDGRHIAVKGETAWYVYDTATGQREVTLQVPNAQSIYRFAFSRDGRFVIVQNRGSSPLYVYDVATGREKCRFDGGQKSDQPGTITGDGVTCFAVSADGGRIATGSAWSRVTVWDFATGKELLAIEGRAFAPSIAEMAFSPDGRRLGYCAVDTSAREADHESRNWVKVLDIASKRVEITIPLKRPAFYVESLAFSPDCQRVVVVSREKKVMEWDVATGQATSTLHVPGDTIAFAYLADAPRLAARSADGSVSIQDAASGKRKFTLKSPVVGPVSSVAFSPDGKRVATRNGDQTVKVWDLATGRDLFTLPGPLGDVSRESFSPDGSRIALVSAGVGKVFDVTKASERELFTIRSGDSRGGGDSRIARVAYRPDGGALVSRTELGQVETHSPHNGQGMQSLKEEPGGITDIVFSPDGRRMATVSAGTGSGRRVRFFRDTYDYRLLEFPMEGVIRVVFTANTAHVIANGPDGLRVWDETGQAARILDWGGIYSVAISPDGRLIAAGGGMNSLKVWDALTGQERLAREIKPDDPMDLGPPLGKVTFIGAVVGVCFSPDGRRLVPATNARTIRVLDSQTGEEVLTLSGHGGRVGNVLWSLDGRRIVSSSSLDRTIRVWDAQTGQSQLCFPMSKDRVGDVMAISPDGSRIVARGGEPSVLVVYDTATGQVQLTLQGRGTLPERPGDFASSTFSPDGQRIVTGEGDGTIRVWDAATGEEEMTLKGHTGAVSCLAFSPDGQRIVSGAHGKTEPGQPRPGELKVWDAVSGQEKLSLKGHTRPITGVAFSGDGTRIVSGSEDGTVRVWEAPAGQSRAGK